MKGWRRRVELKWRSIKALRVGWSLDTKPYSTLLVNVTEELLISM